MRTYRVLIWTFVFVAFLGGLGALFWYYTQNELPPSFERTIGTGAAGQGPGELNEPTGVGVDGSGNVYVLDTRNCRVQRFDPQGKLIDVWGSQGSGDAQMREPIRLKLAPDNTVWVADTGNSRLLHFSTQGEYLGEVGSLGQDEGQFVAPIGIAFDSEGYMWVSDARSNRLQLFSPKGEFRSALENNGSLNFNQPWGLDINGNDEIIVANTNANQILKFNAEGSSEFSWLGTKYSNIATAPGARPATHSFAKAVLGVQIGFPSFVIFNSDQTKLTIIQGYQPADELIMALWYFASGDNKRYSYDSYRKIFNKEIRPTMNKKLGLKTNNSQD